jgi:hypothetical protein
MTSVQRAISAAALNPKRGRRLRSIYTYPCRVSSVTCQFREISSVSVMIRIVPLNYTDASTHIRRSTVLLVSVSVPYPFREILYRCQRYFSCFTDALWCGVCEEKWMTNNLLNWFAVVKNYKDYFGIYPSSGIYDKKSQRFGDWICLRPQVDGAR